MQNTQGEKYNMPSTKKTRSYAIALSGILSAICIVLMFCTGFIPIGVYILPAVAGLVVWIIYREISRKWALLCYAAVALLALLLTPDIESKLLFTGFFGYYPVIRDLLTKVKPAVLSFLLRFICFNVPVWDSLLKILQDSDSLRCLLSGLSETLHSSAMTYV